MTELEMTKNFARNLDNLLYEKRITARDLASKIGISEASMSKYKHATYLPKADILQAIAKALNVSVDYLLCSDGSMTAGEMKSVLFNFDAKNPDSVPSIDSPTLDYELNIIEKLPMLTDEAKQLISQTVDALIDGNQQNVRFMKAYFDALNRIRH